MATCEASTSTMTAPARSAMKRSPLGPIVTSLGEIRAQEGSVFQPTGPDGSPKPAAEPGRCETAMIAACSAGRSAQKTSWNFGRVDVELDPWLLAFAGWILGGPQGRSELAVRGLLGEGLQGFAFVGDEGADVDQTDDVLGLRRGVGDDHAAVGVPDQQHRTRDLVDDAGDVGGITGDTAQRIGRGHHANAFRL